MDALVVRSSPSYWRDFLPATVSTVELVPMSGAVAEALRIASGRQLEETWSHDYTTRYVVDVKESTSRAIVAIRANTEVQIALDETWTRRYLADLDVHKILELARMNIAHVERMADADRQASARKHIVTALESVTNHATAVLQTPVMVQYSEGRSGFFGSTQSYTVTVSPTRQR